MYVMVPIMKHISSYSQLTSYILVIFDSFQEKKYINYLDLVDEYLHPHEMLGCNINSIYMYDIS